MQSDTRVTPIPKTVGDHVYLRVNTTAGSFNLSTFVTIQQVVFIYLPINVNGSIFFFNLMSTCERSLCSKK